MFGSTIQYTACTKFSNIQTLSRLKNNKTNLENQMYKYIKAVSKYCIPSQCCKINTSSKSFFNTVHFLYIYRPRRLIRSSRPT